MNINQKTNETKELLKGIKETEKLINDEIRRIASNDDYISKRILDHTLNELIDIVAKLQKM